MNLVLAVVLTNSINLFLVDFDGKLGIKKAGKPAFFMPNF